LLLFLLLLLLLLRMRLRCCYCCWGACGFKVLRHPCVHHLPDGHIGHQHCAAEHLACKQQQQ
jgi:hypothetical protein